MIRKWTMIIASTALLGGTAASALDLNQMSADEKEAFGAAVREYLIENPNVLMEAIAVLEQQNAEDQAAAEVGMIAANADAIFGDDHSYVGGNPDGDVTVVEFMDYRCSYCRRAHPEVAELVASDGSIRKIVKEFPILGEESVEASRFAISVLQLDGPEAYAAMNNTLIKHRGSFDRKSLERIADDAGLDSDRILAHMNSEDVNDVLRKNHALARELNITGTPTFVFGDQMVRGYLPLDGMREVVAELRTR